MKDLMKELVLSEDWAYHNKLNVVESQAVLFERNKLIEEDNLNTKWRLKLIDYQKKEEIIQKELQKQ